MFRVWDSVSGVADGRQMYGLTEAEARLRRPHTLDSIVPALEQACDDVEAEVAELEAEAEKTRREIAATIGDLSDLRYGRFAKGPGGLELREEVIEGLKGLREGATG